MISTSHSSGIRSSGSLQWTLAEELASIFEMKGAKSLFLKVAGLDLSSALLEVSSVSCGKNSSSLIRLCVWERRERSQSARSWASRQAHLLCCRSLWTWHPTWECSWNSWLAFAGKQWHGEARSSSPASSRDGSLARGRPPWVHFHSHR